MKRIFHPLIPLCILLFLVGNYSYDNFFSEKYDSKVSTLLFAMASNGENTSRNYLDLNRKIEWKAKETWTWHGIGNDDLKVKDAKQKLEKLEEIYQKYVQQIDSNTSIKKLYVAKKKSTTPEEFESFGNEYCTIKNLHLQTLFTDYLKEISEVDSFLVKKYEGYIFESNQTDKELEVKYLNGRKIEILIHLARFKAEMTQIYTQAVSILVEEYVYFPNNDTYYAHSFYKPLIKKNNQGYYVEIDRINPFNIWRDTTVLKSQIKTNVNYYFKNGFIMIDEKYFDDEKLKFEWYLEDNSDSPFMKYEKKGGQNE